MKRCIKNKKRFSKIYCISCKNYDRCLYLIEFRKAKRQMLEHENMGNIEKSRKIGNNTLEIYYKNGDRAIKLHHTNIITFKSNGDMILTSGGWKTVTTKARINRYSPFHLTQKNSIWNISPTFTGKGYTFYDGITFDKDKNLKSENKSIDMKVINKLKKQIRGYVNLIDKLETVPKPSQGDCWCCLFKETEIGKTWGDMSSHDHLLSHIKEGYIFGAILVNAMKERGYRDMQIALHYDLSIKDSFKRALRAYLYKRLIKI